MGVDPLVAYPWLQTPALLGGDPWWRTHGWRPLDDEIVNFGMFCSSANKKNWRGSARRERKHPEEEGGVRRRRRRKEGKIDGGEWGRHALVELVDRQGGGRMGMGGKKRERRRTV